VTEILKETKNTVFDGCDFVVKLPKTRKNTKIKLLQITDMQVIDATQCRTPDRLRDDEKSAWNPDNFDVLCANQIRALVTQTEPDLIFITGDIIYGQFDDAGTTFDWFCSFMDSFEIPWAPVFGNHDNESYRGVAWQCERFTSSKYCLFRRGTVTGNGNYSVGIAVGEELVRVMYMLDSNGCYSDDPDVIRPEGIYPDQVSLVQEMAQRISMAQNRMVPAFMAFHIPTAEFHEAERANGYDTEERTLYTLGVDVPAKSGDFGFKLETFKPITVEGNFMEVLKACHVDGMFAGHCHAINTCISYQGICWVFGLKTGLYDYHIPGQLGGTLVTLEGDDFAVCHVPALTAYGPFPGKAKIFENFFAKIV